MYGKDVERILGVIEAVKIVTENTIQKLAELCAYQLTHYGPHDVVLIPWSPPCYPIELEYPIGPIIADIAPSMTPFYVELQKMNIIQANMYASPAEITNSIQSPWNELQKMAVMFERASEYEGKYVPYNYLGEKVGCVHHLNAFYTAVCDTKWPMCLYHDWVQRGFDHLLNGNSPSISWTDSLTGAKTIGQNAQSYSENVHVSGSNKNPY